MQDLKPYSVIYNAGWDSCIKNLESLPAGLGCKFLKCLIGEGKDLIAKSWHRSEPEPECGYMIFRFL